MALGGEQIPALLQYNIQMEEKSFLGHVWDLTLLLFSGYAVGLCAGKHRAADSENTREGLSSPHILGTENVSCTLVVVHTCNSSTEEAKAE